MISRKGTPGSSENMTQENRKEMEKLVKLQTEIMSNLIMAEFNNLEISKEDILGKLKNLVLELSTYKGKAPLCMLLSVIYGSVLAESERDLMMMIEETMLRKVNQQKMRDIAESN